jgi:hypothetical protein
MGWTTLLDIFGGIMISKQIHFRLFERPNAHRKSGKEWALNAQFVGHEAWTLKTWESKPAEKTVADTKETILRAFEFYHSHLQIPHFEMDVVDV